MQRSGVAYGAGVTSAAEVAYIYPAPYWALDDHDWIKSLLLFFDEVAILLPDYMYGRHRLADPTLVQPLEELGLLRVLEPSDWIDTTARLELVQTMNGLIGSGAFDALDRTDHFQELSQSRAGYGVDIDVADELVHTLFEMGLARPTGDGVSIPMHPVVRSTMLVLLGQLARGIGSRQGLNVHPTTAEAVGVRDLLQFLLVEDMPSAGRVVTLDCEPAGLDMGPVSLDDLLQFRVENLATHKAYMTSLRGFMIELGDVPQGPERDALLIQRREALADQARALQKHSRTQLRKNLGSFGVGVAGAAWSAVSGDLVGLALGGGSLLLGIGGSQPNTLGAYSYVFAASGRWR
jgi:hypothetical protein